MHKVLSSALWYNITMDNYYKDKFNDAMDEVKKLRTDLKSSVKEKGDTVTEIIHFKHGEKKTFEGVKTDTIQQSEYTRFDLEDGRRIYINGDNVNFFEVFSK